VQQAQVFLDGPEDAGVALRELYDAGGDFVPMASAIATANGASGGECRAKLVCDSVGRGLLEISCGAAIDPRWLNYRQRLVVPTWRAMEPAEVRHHFAVYGPVTGATVFPSTSPPLCC
jgi:hypothetical protein